jgi:glycosyltransferase involved in cell wall biosynthesis
VVGEWDESFFLYSEEVDYCRRARVAGFKVRYVATALAEHECGEYGTNRELWRTLVRNRVRYYRRHHGFARSAIFQAGLVANEMIRSPFSSAHRAGLAAAIRIDQSQPMNGQTDASDGFIWFAAQDWWYHNQAHSDFQLMRELARTRPVLVVNSLGLRVPRRGVSTHPVRRIARKLRSIAKFVRSPLPDNPGFHVMTPLLLPFYGNTAGSRINAWLIRRQVQAVAAAVGIGARPTIGVTIPTAWPVVCSMKRSALIYNRSDLHSAFPEADNRWVALLESELMRHSDRVLYVSKELMHEDQDIVGDRGFFLDHGVDLDHFARGTRSDVAGEIAKIPHPRIGFFGGLDDYVVDMSLLKQTAVDLSDVQLILIGDATCPMDELIALPNVHWLGYRPYETIPALGRGFDVALMPWLDNDWIRFANPIKLKEYLALGLPVVTTAYPGVDDYRDRVWVAKSPEEFTELIRVALVEPGDPDARRRSVLGDSWQVRAQTLGSIAEALRGA